MVRIGKAPDVFWKDVSAMFLAETKTDFCKARKNINGKYMYHNSHNYATLKEF